MQPGYMQQQQQQQQPGVPGGHIPPQRHEYGHYDQGGYSRGYEPLNSAGPKSLPPTPTTVPPMMPPRDQQQPFTYPPPNLQRPMNNLSPVPMDSRNVPYRPSPYMGPGASPIDSHRPNDPSPVHMKYEERREPAPQPSPMYDNSRAPYYPGATTPQMSQAPYPQNPPLSQWSGSGHAQQ